MLIREIVRPRALGDGRAALERIDVAGTAVCDGRQHGHTADHQVHLGPKVRIGP